MHTLHRTQSGVNARIREAGEGARSFRSREIAIGFTRSEAGKGSARAWVALCLRHTLICIPRSRIPARPVWDGARRKSDSERNSVVLARRGGDAALGQIEGFPGLGPLSSSSRGA